MAKLTGKSGDHMIYIIITQELVEIGTRHSLGHKLMYAHIGNINVPIRTHQTLTPKIYRGIVGPNRATHIHIIDHLT